MQKFKDWQNSAISLMGDLDIKRGTVSKAIMVGLLGIMAAKIAVSPMTEAPGEAQDTQNGIEHNQLSGHLSDIGKKLNAEYGSEHTVIVLHDDPGLKFVLDNAKPELFRDYTYKADTLSGKVRNTVSEFARDKLGLDINMDSVKRDNIYDNFKADDSARVRLVAAVDYDKPYDAIAMVKGWDGNPIADAGLNYPVHFSANAQNSFTFFHELTHAVDTRDGRPTMDRSADDACLHTEAIADLSASLLFYKKTGNLDEWNYNIRPFRLANSGDISHSTSTIIDGALEKVDLNKLSGMSDREVMIYAKETINTHVQDMLLESNVGNNGVKFSDWELMRRTEAQYVGDSTLTSSYKEDYEDWSAGVGAKSPGDVMRDHGRAAMEASLNNLLYNDEFKLHSEEFSKSVVDHIIDYDDEKVGEAFAIAIGGDGETIDPKVFAKEMGFKLDPDAALRKDQNQQILSEYFSEKTGKNADIGFEEKSFGVNESAFSRYMEKTADYLHGKAESFGVGL